MHSLRVYFLGVIMTFFSCDLEWLDTWMVACGNLFLSVHLVCPVVIAAPYIKVACKTFIPDILAAKSSPMLMNGHINADYF